MIARPKIVGVGLALSLAALRAEDVSNKMLVRTGGGLISNTAIKSTAVNIGKFNVLGQLYFNRYLSVGAGFQADFDFVKGIMPLKSIDLQSRLYLLGIGTQVTETASAYRRTYRSSSALYLLGEFSLRSYRFVVDNGQLTGSTGNVNFGLGIDVALSRHYEFNFECGVPVLGFNSDPSNVKLRVLSVMAGLGYIF